MKFFDVMEETRLVFFVRVVEINSSTDYLEIFALNQVFQCYGWDTVGVFVKIVEMEGKVWFTI